MIFAIIFKAWEVLEECANENKRIPSPKLYHDKEGLWVAGVVQRTSDTIDAAIVKSSKKKDNADILNQLSGEK